MKMSKYSSANISQTKLLMLTCDLRANQQDAMGPAQRPSEGNGGTAHGLPAIPLSFFVVKSCERECVLVWGFYCER